MQHAAAVVFITHVDEIDNNDPAQIAQPELAGNRLRRFDVGIKDGVIKIAVADERPGVDVHGGHGFGLIDDQIAARFQLDFAFQRALNFVFDVKEIENRLATAVMLKFAGHFRDVFRGEFQQGFVGQTGIDADAIQVRVGKITQHTLGQRQFAVHLVARLRAFFALHHFCPYALQVSGIGRQILFANAFGGGANDKSALLIAVFRNDAL